MWASRVLAKSVQRQVTFVAIVLAADSHLWQGKLMINSAEISEDLNRRIDKLAKLSSLTRGQIIEDALAHGRSLAWQEKWIAGVQTGLQDADRGHFATEEDIAAVLNKYNRPSKLCMSFGRNDLSRSSPLLAIT